MSLLPAGLIFVPLLDLSVKWLVLRRLAGRAVSLGALGKIEIVRTRVWLARFTRPLAPVVWWSAWTLAAGALLTATRLAPACGWAAGLLLGGSLSHLIESTARGWICDYCCLRFWPAFNLADVAICAGALGLVAELALIAGRGN
jgi:lipoprotein signal peptidase